MDEEVTLKSGTLVGEVVEYDDKADVNDDQIDVNTVQVETPEYLETIREKKNT